MLQQLFARSVDAFLDAQEDTEQTTIRGVRQAEEAARTAGNGHGVESDGERLETIDGTGETYANRLRGAGIESLEQLAGTGSETVADTAEVSESRANEWITNVQSQS